MKTVIALIVTMAVIPGQLMAGDISGSWTFTTDDQNSPFNLDLMSIFQTRGLKYTAFIMTSTVGNTGKCSWNDLREMLDSGALEIGSHGTTHVFPLLPKEAISIRNTDMRVPHAVSISQGNDRTTTVRIGRWSSTFPGYVSVRNVCEEISQRLATDHSTLTIFPYDVETAAFPISELEPGNMLVFGNESSLVNFRRGWTMEQLNQIFAESQQVLLNKLGVNVESFAFPYGVSCPTSRDICAKYYRQSRVTKPGASMVEFSPQTTIFKRDWLESSWFTRGQNDNSRFAIPTSVEIQVQLYDLSDRRKRGQVTRTEARGELNQIVDAQIGNRVVVLDHKGSITPGVYEDLLDILTNRGIPIFPFGELCDSM
jgi:hypothetical protein